jgi:DNA polymerase III subunit epsilon
MREIVLDTETTGLDPLRGDRVVEIGGVELENFIPTGRMFHGYFNPERPVPAEATRVHGLTDEFLSGKPLFASVVGDFLDFIAETPLVIHNAPFDMGFLNAELTRLGFATLPMTRAVDTLTMARRLFPGAPNSLDALCKRFGVDASAREWHGALLDARLLADVYLELRGGRQPGFSITRESPEETGKTVTALSQTHRPPRTHAPTDEEQAAHKEFLEAIPNPLWVRRRGA